MADRCICCGEIIPEGRQVCPNCIKRISASYKKERPDMCRNRYSVYNKKTDRPLVLYGTSKECAKAMGITVNSFYRYLCRMRGGKIKIRKWDVYEDEVEDLEDDL